MTRTPDDDRTTAYLWDPAASADAVDPDVRALEQQLAPLRFDPATRPFRVPSTAPARRRPHARWFALAAVVLIVATAGVGFSRWRWTWPAGQAWTVSTRSPSAPAALAIGAPLALPSAETAVIDVARIGTMRVEGGSRLALRSTQGTRHRLTMESGRVALRVWAPPGSVAIQTPAGEVIDLGCEFDLEVDSTRSRVQVRSGWVQLENGIDESLIPAGASSEMTRDARPGVPVFDASVPAFAAAVRRYEQQSDAPSVDVIVRTARVEDVLTLLLLVERATPGVERMASRAAELWPMPDGVTVGGVIRGDRDGLWRWRDTLPLPPVKGWLRNWRDALPVWLSRNAR